MRLITASFSLLLAFAGCHPSPTFTSEVRDSANGVERLHSRSHVRDGAGRFECLASISGRCHYVVYDDDCARDTALKAAASCRPVPPWTFSVAVGERVERNGLSSHPQVCVGGEHAPAREECGPH